MSEIAGRLAAQAGAYFLQDPLGGRGILVGGVPGVAPARVTVLGGGVVGTHAARVACGMGADVTILDRSLRRLRELEELFDGRARGDHVRPARRSRRSSTRSDVVIGAVLIPGAAAPKLVTREMLAPAAARARCSSTSRSTRAGASTTSRPTTHADPTYEVDGILHYCVANMPGAVPAQLDAGADERDAALHPAARRPRPRRALRVRPGRRPRHPGSRRPGPRRAGGRMSVATAPAYRNLVGGELVEAVDGATRDIVNPRHGRGHRRACPRAPRPTSSVRWRPPAPRRILWRDTTPGERMERAAGAGRRRRPPRRGARRAGVGERRQAAVAGGRGARRSARTSCASSPAPRAPRTRRRRASTARTTRRSCAASRSASSARSRPGTTR